MQIKICSFETRIDSEVYWIIHQNHESYANDHGYIYEEFTDFSKWPQFKLPHFYKFFCIKEALKDCDWLLYVDMDAIFTNRKKIEEFIDPSAEIIMSKDDPTGNRCAYDYAWNNGVILLKNGERVHKLLDVLTTPALCEVFTMLQFGQMTKFFDQSMMEFVFENFNEFKGIVKEIPAKSFNSYVPQRAETGNAWTTGDFILHLPRIQSSRKIAHP